MSRYLIVGGAGFIGVNAADQYARAGHEVTILDNFSRRGTDVNSEWLLSRHPAIRVVRADIRTDRDILAVEAAQCDVLLHLAVRRKQTAKYAYFSHVEAHGCETQPEAEADCA